jgi:putative heme-binding domain-containing protein
LSRLQNIDLDANPGVKAAVMRVLGQVRGTPQLLQIVRQFKIKGEGSALLDLAIINSTNSTGADAMRLVLAEDNDNLLKTALAGTNGVAVAQALGGSAVREASPFLLPLVSDTARSLALRRESVRALAKSKDGAMQLLALAREQKLPTELKLLAASELNNASWPEVKTEAARALPLPKAAGAENLPPIADLIRRNGDPVRGAEIFKRETVGCNKCHLVKGDGTDFGPNLSEIGTKLGKEALYESILDPSAGIAFGFEGWQLDLTNGEEVSGLIVSETADEVAVKAVGGVITHYKKSDIARRVQQKLSAMPADLQRGMTTQDLIDLVEYLVSLKH